MVNCDIIFFTVTFVRPTLLYNLRELTLRGQVDHCFFFFVDVIAGTYNCEQKKYSMCILRDIINCL